VQAPKPRPPSFRFLAAHPAHLVACGFGSGLAPVAPGTFGTLFAWASFVPLARALSEPALLILIGFCFAFGVLACQRTGRALGVVDHGSIVWDEIVPFWLVLALSPDDWRWQLAAFLLFRFFDIVKPPPADYFDARVKNGFGVMMDDVVAAFYTVLSLAVAKRLLDAIGW
jgi:phosphatidylglycerophosphatase A